MLKRLLVIAALCAAISVAMARDAAPVADDPVLEARVMKLSEELRCLVCQNQSLADSHAELAQDLKNQVREMIKRGMSDREVVDYLVQRYGDFVLYRPPIKSTTWLLWGGPFLLLIVGVTTLIVKVRRRPQTAPLTAAEHAEAEALLRDERASS